MLEGETRQGSFAWIESGTHSRVVGQCKSVMQHVDDKEDFSDVPQIGPSINRKGGVRLHPHRDGVIPSHWEPNRVKMRDSGGNVLTEVTDPASGFCLYATSPLMTHGVRVISPTPMVPTTDPKRDGGIMPQFHSATNTWYIGTGSNRRAIRTVDMGDSPLPTVPPKRGTRPTKNSPTGAARASERANGPDRNPNGPARIPTIERSLVVAYINGMAKAHGKPAPVKITKEMIRMAKLALERQRDIAEYCRNED